PPQCVAGKPSGPKWAHGVELKFRSSSRGSRPPKLAGKDRARLSTGLDMADSPDTGGLRRRFERRANWLTAAATIFLVMIVVLLGFGGVIVYQAPALTSKDIAQSYDDRLATTTKEIEKIQARDDDIVKWATTEFKACAPA